MEMINSCFIHGAFDGDACAKCAYDRNAERAASGMRDSAEWLAELEGSGPFFEEVIEHLDEGERECILEWICNIQNQAVNADRARR